MSTKAYILRSQGYWGEVVHYVLLSLVVLFVLYALYLTAALAPLLGFALFSVVLFLLLFFKKRNLLLIFYLYIVVLQNQFIAYTTPFFRGNEFNFTMLHGFNFLVPALLFFYYFIYVKKINRPIANLLLLVLCLLGILGLYFVFGFYMYGMANSASYLRLLSVPFIMFFNGILLARFSHERALKIILGLLLILITTVALWQFFFPRQVTYLLNDQNYFYLKSGFSSIDDLLKNYRTSFLNIAGFPEVYRVSSIIKSIISYGYIVVILAVFLFFKNRKILMFVFVLIAVITVGSKGATLLMFLCLFFYVIRKKIRLSLVLSLLVFSVFWALFIYSGYKANNEHLIGFVSGFRYLDTLGNGLGFSGNLSDIRLSAWNGGPLPDLGYWTRFQNGSESVFGVLFSSLGIVAFLFIFLALTLVLHIYRVLEKVNIEVAILCLLLFFQGIFQEEAFSPYAYGLVMFLAGFYYFQAVSGTSGSK